MKKITKTEEDQLRWFVETVEQMKKSTFLERFKKIQYTLKCGENYLTEEFKQFDQKGEESVVFLASKIRKIYMANESTNFNKIADIILNNSSNKTTLENVVKCKEVFRNVLEGYPSFNVTLNGKRYTNEDMLKHWFNAWDFHTDKSKKRKLEKIMVPKMHRMYYCIAIQKLIKVIFPLSNNVARFLDEEL